MRYCTLSLAVLLLLQPVWLLGQEIFAVQGTERGKAYILVVGDGGEVSIRPLAVVTVGQAPSPPINPQPPTSPLSPFAQEVRNQAATVLSNGGSQTTAAAIAEVYFAVASAVGDGSITTDNAIPAIKAATDMVLLNQPDKDKWGGFRTSLGDSLAHLQQQGHLSTKEQYAKTLKDVGSGLASAAGYTLAAQTKVEFGDAAQPFIGGIDIERVIELIKLVMALLDLFKTFK